MNKRKDVWDEAERTGRPVKLNDLVICDFCDTEYTNSAIQGGLIFGTSAACPECAPRIRARAIRYKETAYIKAICPVNKSFAEFVCDYRGSDATLQITTYNKDK